MTKRKQKQTLYEAGQELREAWIELAGLIADKLKLAILCEKLEAVLRKVVEFIQKRKHG